MRNPAALAGRDRFPPITAPVWILRQIKSPAVISPKWRPSGFIHIASGNSGSRTEMWPLMPSVKLLREKKRNMAAVCIRICSRSSWKEGNLGMPGLEELACDV